MVYGLPYWAVVGKIVSVYKLTSLWRQDRYGFGPLLPTCGWHGQVWMNDQLPPHGMVGAGGTERTFNCY